jgi:hypothetical protein
MKKEDQKKVSRQIQKVTDRSTTEERRERINQFFNRR